MSWILHLATLVVALAFMLAAPASAVQKRVGKACDNTAFGGGCGAGRFCQLGQCFSPAPLSGTCTVIPQVCLNNLRPVCGCDGITYRNDCRRRQARVSKAKDGNC